MLVYAFMYSPTSDFMSDFALKFQFYAGNAILFVIHSDPFSEVFLRNLSSKVSMHANYVSYYLCLYRCVTSKYARKS